MSSKENKKRAQERRAMERAKAERDARLKKLCIGVLAVAVVAALIILPGTLGTTTEEDSSEETTEEAGLPQEGDTTEDAAAEETSAEEAPQAPALDTTVGREVQEGDTVNIDYTGYKDGEAFEGGSTNGAGADLAIGSGTYIDGFESGLVGKKVGDTVDLNLTFPEDYGAEDLAGADVVFTVTINGIYN